MHLKRLCNIKMETKIRATSPKDPSVLPAITGIWLLVSVLEEMTSHKKDITQAITKNIMHL